MTFSGKSLSSAFLAFSAAFSTLATAHGNPVVWTAPSMHRVGMSDAAGSGTEVSLSAARGEYESFQIVANGASTGLGNVNVTISDLQGPARASDPADQFHPLSRKIHARHFVQSQLEGVESTHGSRLVSRRADPIQRSGYRQAAIGCESDSRSVRSQSRQEPAGMGRSSGPSVGPARKVFRHLHRDEQSGQLHRLDLTARLEFRRAHVSRAQILVPVFSGRYSGRAARTPAQ